MARSSVALRDVASAQRELMAGYREAMRKSDRLDRMNRAFIHHVVAVSGEAVSNRLLTRVEKAQQLAAEIREFAQEVRSPDAISGILSFGQAQAKARIGALLTFTGFLAIVAAIGTFFSDIGDFGQALGAIMNVEEVKATFLKQSLFTKLLNIAYLLYGVGALLAGIGSYFDLIGETIRASHPSQEVLAQTIDQPEARLFSLTGGMPPGRPTMQIVGRAGACALLVAGGITVWFVARVLHGAFATKSATLDPFSKILQQPVSPIFRNYDPNSPFLRLPDTTPRTGGP